LKMKIELTTISNKKFLLIALLSIPLIMFLSLGLAILTSTQGLVYIIIPLLGLSIFLAQRLSRTITEIDLSENEQLKINTHEISYEDVTGYFVNDTGMTQTTLCLRLKTEKTIQITSSSVGEHGKKFREAQKAIIEKLRSKNGQMLELEYQDVYVRQTNNLRPILYVLAGIVVLIDIVALYLLVTGKMGLPWQIFFVNFILIWLIPYIKKRKTINANSAKNPDKEGFG
jgi:hypothetical protein